MAKTNPGRKHPEYVFMQAVQHEGRASPESLGRTPKIYKRMGVTLHRFRHRTRALASDISNQKSFARFIRMNYGFGHFVILFWDYRHVNKKFNPNFTCIGDQCKYKQKKKCRVYSKHEQGWSCKKNAKRRPSWTARARIIIEPTSDAIENDYSYKWLAEADFMSKMFFWKGSGGKSRQERQEEREILPRDFRWF